MRAWWEDDDSCASDKRVSEDPESAAAATAETTHDAARGAGVEAAIATSVAFVSFSDPLLLTNNEGGAYTDKHSAGSFLVNFPSRTRRQRNRLLEVETASTL